MPRYPVTRRRLLRVDDETASGIEHVPEGSGTAIAAWAKPFEVLSQIDQRILRHDRVGTCVLNRGGRRSGKRHRLRCCGGGCPYESTVVSRTGRGARSEPEMIDFLLRGGGSSAHGAGVPGGMLLVDVSHVCSRHRSVRRRLEHDSGHRCGICSSVVDRRRSGPRTSPTTTLRTILHAPYGMLHHGVGRSCSWG